LSASAAADREKLAGVSNEVRAAKFAEQQSLLVDSDIVEKRRAPGAKPESSVSLSYFPAHIASEQVTFCPSLKLLFENEGIHEALRKEL